MSVLVAFDSLNQVHRIRRKLQTDGLYLDLVRVPKSTGLPGCGFAVRASENALGQVMAVAKEFSIIPAGLFPEKDEP